MPTYNTVSTEVDIANLALDMVKEAPISALDENRAAARWMNRNYAPMRDFVLASFPWRFAIARAELSADSNAPSFGYERRFALPTDCLRLQPLRYEGRLNGRLIEHEVEGNFVLTNAPAPLKVRYIKRILNVGDMTNTPLFVEALAARLAVGIAHWLSGKQAYAERASKVYQEALQQAAFLESNVGTPPDQYANAYDDARFTYAEHNVKYGSSAANN